MAEGASVGVASPPTATEMHLGPSGASQSRFGRAVAEPVPGVIVSSGAGATATAATVSTGAKRAASDRNRTSKRIVAGNGAYKTRTAARMCARFKIASPSDDAGTKRHSGSEVKRKGPPKRRTSKPTSRKPGRRAETRSCEACRMRIASAAPGASRVCAYAGGGNSWTPSASHAPPSRPRSPGSIAEQSSGSAMHSPGRWVIFHVRYSTRLGDGTHAVTVTVSATKPNHLRAY
mmetsp:Transcript_33038/g.113685  ORF Transcript_33038/g.113685 Transcript_33038/m.113685 type:complete len:233 (+) Transcript_33038:892-1590(+)